MAYSVDTSSRITGLASGIDTDSMVKELMAAERMPLDKMEQDVSWTEWKRDSYRDMNKLFYDLDQQTLDMKLQKTYQSKTTASTNESAVTATATANATNSSYQIGVEDLATTAINVSKNGISGDANFDQYGKLSDQVFSGDNITADGSFDISYYNEDGTKITKNITYKADDSLNNVLKKIGSATDNEIRATYDTQSDKVIIERTKTGDFNTTDEFLGAEIGFNGSGASDFLVNTLQLKNGEQQTDGTWKKVESGGTDARFTYNGREFTSKDNSYTLNDVTFNFTSKTNGIPATITIDNDVDAAFDKVMKFVESYNTAIETVNEALQEDRYRDFKPLTEAQREGMSENEIEKWEEKSRSGLLKGDSILSSGLSSMRSNWYSTVDNASNFNSITDIGITTSSDYMDKGKLEVDEDELKAALRTDPDSVHKLFSNDVQGAGRGIINRLEDSIANTIDRVEERAGKPSSTLQQYTLGRRLDDMEDRISAFEDRLRQTEDRYWSQFATMEKMIQQMNSQSSYLMQQFSM
ncbi:flagellar hook-associated protein 2 [Paraliobacillus quinghaiensis]|uniref:Flagellar hook-associated protein 2 n=1 Tax=Paraliobacillus quinghaiensis TaxID=470815 RepID=A0A917WV72_9BACI|nr:flagellar hook-associated protein 2 [Paraliobacillus quinghaiensis]GGM35396.1 flagellar hook-associated protein 2 [Paraliobacillus quinghaiensis]